MSVASGAETAITSGLSSVLSYRLSRDGSLIVVGRGPTPLEDDKHRAELWVMDAGGGNAREVTHNDVEEAQPEFSPDNSRILFLAETNERLEPYYNSNVFVMPASGGTPKPVLPDFQYAIDQAAWSPDGTSILAVANMGVHSEIIEIDASTRQWKAAHERRPLHPADLERRGAGRPDGVPVRRAHAVRRRVDAGDSGRARRRRGRSRARHRRVRRARIGRSRCRVRRRWRGRAPTARRSKACSSIRPATSQAVGIRSWSRCTAGRADSDKFGAGAGLLLSYFPVLTGHGYAVFRPNYRGSTGYGNAFYRDVVGGYFRNMHFDVMAGVDFLVKRGIADPDRLVAMGWSAGGHLTNKLVTMTTRFKAASSGAGVADWTSMYAQSDARANRTLWFGGTPWQKNAPIAMFWNHSPLKDVANVKTPTLFFVGESDARVPLAQSIVMYRALKSHGVPTHLYVGAARGPSVERTAPSDLQGQHRAGLVCTLRARRRVLRP